MNTPPAVLPPETVASACAALIAFGWEEYPDQFHSYARCFYKRHATPTRCCGNADKDGIQIGLYVSELQDQPNYEMELCAELSDGTWVKVIGYAHPRDIRKCLATVPRLLAAWEAMASATVSTSPPLPDEDTITDGYGSSWSRTCAMCGKQSMEIVRPGKVQCANCG